MGWKPLCSVQAEGLIHQLRCLHSVVNEVDVCALPLILTSFAIQSVIHQLVKIVLRVILGGRAHPSVHGDVGLHPTSLCEPDHPVDL